MCYVIKFLFHLFVDATHHSHDLAVLIKAEPGDIDGKIEVNEKVW